MSVHDIFKTINGGDRRGLGVMIVTGLDSSRVAETYDEPNVATSEVLHIDSGLGRGLGRRLLFYWAI